MFFYNSKIIFLLDLRNVISPIDKNNNPKNIEVLGASIPNIMSNNPKIIIKILPELLQPPGEILKVFSSI